MHIRYSPRVSLFLHGGKIQIIHASRYSRNAVTNADKYARSSRRVVSFSSEKEEEIEREALLFNVLQIKTRGEYLEYCRDEREGFLNTKTKPRRRSLPNISCVLMLC